MSFVVDHLIKIKEEKGAGYLVLIDPDKQDLSQSTDFAARADKAGVDAFLVGSSFMMSDQLDEVVKTIRGISKLPTIIFPGASSHISPYADAILFLSLISGRNPEFLIGEHIKAAPVIKRHGIEAIPTGYMLIDGGCCTSVQFISATMPIPRDKVDIAIAHAVAAELLGMKMVYLECGSGAKIPVPDEMIRAVKSHIEIPLIVGGGIRKPEEAAAKVKSGADFIVTGNVLENTNDPKLIQEFSEAIHNARTS